MKLAVTDKESQKTYRNLAGIPLPIWFFSAVSLFIGLSLAVFSFLNYQLSHTLRTEYLSKEAQTIAGYMESQLRGPLRRDLDGFPILVEEVRQQFPDKLVYLGVYDHNGSFTYHTRTDQVGKTSLHSAPFSTPGIYVEDKNYVHVSEDVATGVFTLNRPMLIPGGGGMGRGRGLGGATYVGLEIGIRASVADFILSQARRQVGISLLAFLFLTLFSCILPWAASRFLSMQREQEKQRHWANMGRLSASLAHEIRNPLGAIKGLSQLLLERMKQDAPEREFAETIVGETKRLEALVNSLLAFARMPDPQKEKTDVVILVRQVLENMHLEWEKSRITVSCRAVPESILIDVDPNQIRQVLWNLFLNARDAMPEGGSLKVSIEMTAGKDAVALSVQDSGSGFTAEAMQNLYEPFFTTKTQGNGLGLAISRQILLRHQGRMCLENAPFGGARCTLFLPIRGI
jgi:signal transduction histidine kinase